MNLSLEGEKLLKSLEALALQPYDDQKGLQSAPIKRWVKGATIGYGHLISQSEWNKYKNGITKTEAEMIFKNDLAPFVKAVNEGLEVKLCQHQFDALVILCFNIGIPNFNSSSVLKMVNGQAGNYKSLEEAWKAFKLSQGKVSNGLINRRAAEWKIYTQGIYERW